MGSHVGKLKVNPLLSQNISNHIPYISEFVPMYNEIEVSIFSTNDSTQETVYELNKITSF
jgi:hypothetical protein